MNSILTKIETEKKKKIKNKDKFKNLENELVKIKYAKNPNKLHQALKELNKKEVID